MKTLSEQLDAFGMPMLDDFAESIDEASRQKWPKEMGARKLAGHWMAMAYGADGVNDDDVEYYSGRLSDISDQWKLVELPVSQIDGHHSGHDASDDYIDDYMKQHQWGGTDFPPIIVEPKGGRYQTLDGQHRLKAAKKLKIKSIQAYVPIHGQVSEGEVEIDATLLRTLIPWLDGKDYDKAPRELMKMQFPEKWRRAPKVLYRGEGVDGTSYRSLEKGKAIKAYGISWTLDRDIAQKFAKDNDHPFGVIFEYHPQPEDILFNVHDFLSDPDVQKMFEILKVKTRYNEQEVMLKRNIPLTKGNIVWERGGEAEELDLAEDGEKIGGEYEWQHAWNNWKKYHTGSVSDSDTHLRDRVAQFDKYQVQEIPLEKVRIDGETPDLPLDPSEDEEWAHEYAKQDKGTYPPIILHPSGDLYKVADGRHRTRAAFLRGDKVVRAFVGVK